MPKPLNLGDMALVVWEDAYSDDELYVDAEGTDCQPCIVSLIGFVVEDSPKGICVAREKFGDGRYRSIQFIPRGMVKKVRILR